MSINLEALLETAARKGKASRPCLLGKILAELPDVYRDALQALFDDSTVATRTIAERLSAAGLPGAETTIWKHRNGACVCFKQGGAA